MTTIDGDAELLASDSLLADMKAVAESPCGRVRDLAAATIFERMAKRADDCALVLRRIASDENTRAREYRRIAQLYRDGAISDSLFGDGEGKPES